MLKLNLLINIIIKNFKNYLFKNLVYSKILINKEH